MDKEIINLILESKYINSDQKTEIIKTLIKNTLHIPRYPFNEPYIEPYRITNYPFYQGTEVYSKIKDVEAFITEFNNYTNG